jgi:uncharacterized membrane protein required for colicin V production
MVSLTFVFFMFVVMFGLIGASRGWAKEMLVTFGAVLALFLLALLEQYVPVVVNLVRSTEPDAMRSLFWLRFVIIVLLAFFGYQTPYLPRLAGGQRFVREKLQDTLLGFVLGALNAFLVVGSLWYYLHQAGYPFEYITPPIEGTPAGDAAIRLLAWMAPAWLTIPYIYFAVAMAFIFVIVVFL